MAKFYGYSANSQNLQYVRDNAHVLYLATSADKTYAQLTANNAYIVSSNISGADFSIASAAQGTVLTIGAKNNQPVEGSGNATHLYLVSTVSGARICLVTTVSSQILASGNTVNVASWTVTANICANNS